MYEADKFVFLDDAQYSNGYVFNWNTIKVSNGTCRLRIPIKYEFGDAINQVKMRNELKWCDKHLKTVYMNYHKSKYFNDFFFEYRDLLLEPYDNLSQLNTALFITISRKFGILRPFVLSSEMDLTSKKEQRVIDICKQCKADVYISGHGASAYQVPEHFEKEGIELQYSKYKPIEYQQLWGDFVENMSILDYIFNNGFDWDNIVKKVKGAA